MKKIIRSEDILKDIVEDCSSGFFQPGVIASEVLGVTHYGGDISGITLFAYMWRRFGPPWFPCDEDKEMASYYLTTDIAGLWLRVSCKASGICHCFGYAYNRDFAKKLPGNWTIESPFVLECQKELGRVILDLTVPVYVRDIGINLFGLFDDSEDSHQPSKYAGLGFLPYKKEIDKDCGCS